MLRLSLSRGDSDVSVPLHLPSTSDDINRVFVQLDQISTTERTKIYGCDSNVGSLLQYVRNIDLDSGDDLKKLQQLAEKVSVMVGKEGWKFSGALAANSINGIDDVLRVADSLEDYIIIPNVHSDVTLGHYIAETSQFNADPRFPEESWPYLDYTKIGAEYYADHGGAYTYGGYVLRKASLEEKQEQHDTQITVHLSAGTESVVLPLPASEGTQALAMMTLDIDEFAEATIKEVCFTDPFLNEYITMECTCVEELNELAGEIEKLKETDGELLKFLSVLEVLGPKTPEGALNLVWDLDDYERVTGNYYEYGKDVLRRHGADDALLQNLEPYTDFARLGEDNMAEDVVRKTEFGLIRRCSKPFDQEPSSMEMSL